MDQRMPFPMQPGGGYGRMVEFHQGGGGFHWAIFVLLLLLVLLVAAQLAATLLRPRHRGPMWKLRHQGPGPWGGPPDPVAFARMRYARGEIDRETFVQLTQDLGGEPGAPPPAPA
ncbi:MAG TPA: hypothetical protein VGN27_05620 [Gaiellaceae bacterium]|jgi:uncharacterized membrane protein|nr:hypothetical protein [Gaiellaceae bacterium]